MKIRYLVLHAYGMGGTIRTVINQAGAVAAKEHDVELVSVLRRRAKPHFPIDPRVRMVTLVDETAERPASPSWWRPLQQYAHWRHRLLSRLPGLIVPRGEAAFRLFSRLVENAVRDYLSGVHDGVLVTTRPALNILAARYAPPGAVLVAQEHMNLANHRPKVRRAIRRWYPRFDAVVVLTRRDRVEYEQSVPGVRVRYIPNAVHSLDQTPSGHTNKIVVAAGRLSRQKGFDLLIPAFEQVVERHPDWQLRIYGTGAKKAQLRALIEERHLYNHVLLMGRTQRLDDELAKASLFVLSSRFEGLPMVMIEAMAHALPVVSFDCPTGPGDVLTQGVEGLLVPPEDIEALAGAMDRLIADPSLRRAMGAAAAQAVSATYSPEAVTPQWEALFAELLEAQGSASIRSSATRA